MKEGSFNTLDPTQINTLISTICTEELENISLKDISIKFGGKEILEIGGFLFFSPMLLGLLLWECMIMLLMIISISLSELLSFFFYWEKKII